MPKKKDRDVLILGIIAIVAIVLIVSMVIVASNKFIAIKKEVDDKAASTQKQIEQTKEESDEANLDIETELSEFEDMLDALDEDFETIE